MVQTHHYKHKHGVTVITEHESDEHYGLHFKTNLPKINHHIHAYAFYDDKGMVSFSAETITDEGSTLYKGQRSKLGLNVEINSLGFKGTAFFEAGVYDLTTFDLYALELEDVQELTDGSETEIHVLDPIRFNIHRALASGKLSKDSVSEITLEFDDEVHFQRFSNTGEILDGHVKKMASPLWQEQKSKTETKPYEWQKVSKQDAEQHLKTF